MNCVLLIAAAFVAVCSAASLDRLNDHYEVYKKAHNKSYSNPHQHAVRFAQFSKTHAMIEAHNARNHSFKMAHNKFSDMTDAEKTARLGAVYPGRDSDSRMLGTFLESADRAVPTSMDLRTSSCLGAVKDQGQCGSCWAFSATAALEYSNCKKHGSYVSLSEQDLVDCSEANGCDGGWYYSAWSYVKSTGGQDTDASYPYSSDSYDYGVSGTCAFDSTTVGGKVSSYGAVAKTATAIKQALSTYGVLSVAIYVADDFYNYASGVYSSSVCGGMGVNHAVNIVGYGTSGTTPYWIVRNSWSSYWGASGYILIKSGVNMCNIESYAYYVVAV